VAVGAQDASPRSAPMAMMMNLIFIVTLVGEQRAGVIPGIF
jgi:hypothetical protein